ncbi:hypothetical protein RCH09_003140 [Actimicrobium sp. GrIS 1.19]|uniref:hypothetical protein n=1 Tax=Actimicrobium sp. GrIS 1.19 TaxID=3071708 RepID=UPI002E014999|nr:hypothetical protein [Actimicrobium sp. GrIS 1.19]
MTAHQQHETDTTARNAGLVIVLCAIASIAAVALDSSAQGSDALSILQSMVKLRDAHQLVHIVAMTCVGGLMFGFTVLSQRLGLRRAPVLAGLIAYAAGSMLMLVATTIDGFISTDTAALFATESPEAVRVGYWMIQTMAGVALTDIARVAWVCQSLAAVAWASAMLRESGLTRRLGVIGLVSGALPAVAVVAAGQAMTETVVVGILLVQGIWNLTAATYLLRGAQHAPTSDPAPGRLSTHMGPT